MPITENENNSMQAALQQVFYNLKYSNKAVATSELLAYYINFKNVLTIVFYYFRNLLAGKAEKHGFNTMCKNSNVFS